jgi:hypothetical protein
MPTPASRRDRERPRDRVGYQHLTELQALQILVDASISADSAEKEWSR